jgi:hypothetical protein
MWCARRGINPLGLSVKATVVTFVVLIAATAVWAWALH